MPNGGYICCLECTYGRSPEGRCDVFGIKTSPHILCRSFRMPRQSHSDARDQWPMLNSLEPGIIYQIDNFYPNTGLNPKPIFRVTKIS
jgi:hypothetical protein